MARIESKAIEEHGEVPLADEGKLEDVVAHFAGRQAAVSWDGAAESACYVASVGSERDPRVREAQLAEILSLVRSRDGRVVGHEICHLGEPDPRTLLGKGTAEAVAARARASGATLLVIDRELSPSQARNLEDAAGISVCDREAVILEVFRRHARTRSARIQVEIAQLEYLRPRIRGIGLDMDQQMGGTKASRGAGETASELLARKIDRRLEDLERALAKVRSSGTTARKGRDGCKRIVLAGYTNAGKTSLMNALASADLSAKDRPFETLDTTSRCLTRHGGEILLSDTVGFIRRFPERLLASFESTLTEIADASLVVVVVDASDPERAAHLATTAGLLRRIGAADVPRFYAWNKVDRLDAPPTEDELASLSEGHPWALVSAPDPAAVARLRDTLIRAVRGADDVLEAFVPYSAAHVLSLVYGRCRVLESLATPRGLKLRIEGPGDVTARIRSGLREVKA